MFRRVITSTARRARINNVGKAPKRNMGGGSAPVPTEGFEGAIRKVESCDFGVLFVSLEDFFFFSL